MQKKSLEHGFQSTEFCLVRISRDRNLYKNEAEITAAAVKMEEKYEFVRREESMQKDSETGVDP